MSSGRQSGESSNSGWSSWSKGEKTAFGSSPYNDEKFEHKRLAYVCDPRHKVMEEICPKVICRISQALHGEPNLWALKFIEEALSMLHGNNEVINVDHYVFPDVPGITHPNIWVSFGFLEPKLPNDRGELLMES